MGAVPTRRSEKVRGEPFCTAEWWLRLPARLALFKSGKVSNCRTARRRDLHFGGDLPVNEK